ncbi:MAG: hypothetical protein H5U02_00010 [Clostridia bacterium]|nr:hypothetical protein [Clostridia bacterium]
MFRSRPPNRKRPILKAVKPEDPEWKLLHRIADSRLDQVKKAFLLAVAATQEKVVVARMAEALQNGDLASVESMIDWGAFGAGLMTVREVFREIVDEAGKATARELSKKLEMELRFDLLNPRAVEFINRHTGELITQVAEESRQAIRAIIRQAFEEGGHPYQQARKIIQHIGLTEKQSRAVENFRRRQLEAGVSRTEADRRAEAYAKRMLRDRAETIARTETLTASNAGQHLAWLDAKDKGLLPANFMKEYITTPDDRLCPKCLSIDGQRKPIDAPFDTPYGPKMYPPIHVRCRCAYGLVEVGRL